MDNALDALGNRRHWISSMLVDKRTMYTKELLCLFFRDLLRPNSDSKQRKKEPKKERKLTSRYSQPLSMLNSRATTTGMLARLCCTLMRL